MTDINNLLEERGKTHGDFRDHALITQTIKALYAGKVLDSVQRESLDMIAHKIGRIIAGDPDHIDHWDDIAGYATLAARYIDNGKNAKWRGSVFNGRNGGCT